MPFDLSALEWVLAVSSALLVGLSKAGFGLGAGLVAVPLMFHVLGRGSAALGVMLVVLIVGDLFSLPHYPRTAHRRSLKALLPGLLLGVGAGWAVLGWFETLRNGDLWLQRCVGALSVSFVGLQVVRGHVARSRPEGHEPWEPSRITGIGVGAGAGFTSSLAHAGGPVIALYLLPQDLGRRAFVGTVLWYFFSANMLKLIPYASKGYLAGGNLLFAAMLAPVVAGGAFAGSWLNKRCSDYVFRWIIYFLAVVAGVGLLVKQPKTDTPAAGRAPVQAATQ